MLVLGKTCTHTHTRAHTLAHMRAHILSFLAPEALTLPVCLPSPMSCIYSPTPFPLSQASPMWGRSQLVWERPQKENTPGGGSDRGIPGGHTVLLRGDEGLAPLDQEARNPKSTHLLRQGTEMAPEGAYR